MLAVTAALGVLFLIVSQGMRGRLWASAVTIGVVSVVALLLIHVLFFAATWIVSQMQSKTPPHDLRPVLPKVVTIPPETDEPKPSTEEP